MCWGTPGKILEINDSDKIAKVDFGGIIREAIIGIEDVNVGDYVMVHAGVVIGKMNPVDVALNLMIYTELAETNYTEMGLSSEEAKTRARKDLENMLAKLGIDPVIIDNLNNNEEKDDEEIQVEQKNQLEIPETAFRKTYKISLSDTDYLQVMHYTNYFKFCERCQQELLSSVGFGYSVLIHKYGCFIPTVETGGKILAPVRLDNEIEVIVWVEDIGKKHVRFRNLILNKTTGKLAADIYTIGVCTDTSITESTELPEEFAKALEPFIFKNERGD